MSRFVLTAQLQLQAPNNVAQVVRQIQSQLSGINVNLNVQGAVQASRQLQQVTAQANSASTAAERMGRAFALSVRRFAAFSIATRAVSLFTSTLADSIQTAIDFERQMVKISQVTGESMANLKGLTKSITDLATGFGVGSQSLLEASTLLLQAGISAKDTEVALKTLAKAALAPNFDSLSETTEGAIAILAQFGEGVGALEKQLGAINAVAGAFAVEAGDLIDVIRRAGGVFKSSGGDLNELIALFTSVRATTRESAESIGTGLRTIFTRIQRPKTIEFLKQFGVELVDLEGKFVGPFEAVKRLSSALAGLGEGDITFIRIAEELGGFRQIGKVLPLLQQFATAQQALNVANKAGNSLTNDAVTAQQALAIRITKVKEEFLALVRGVTETKTFQIMANTALTLASALIKISEAIKPLLPLLAAVAAVKIAKGIGGFFGSFGRGLSRNNFGGKIHAFARGGMVPGSGNRDTVPAMLQPGEFVIKKSSVKKLGASNLAAMNENKYSLGGMQKNLSRAGDISLKSAVAASTGRRRLTIQEMIKASRRAGYDLERLDNGKLELSRNNKIYHTNLTDDQASQLLASMATGYAGGGIVNTNRGFYGSVDPDGRSLVGKTKGLTLQQAINAGFKRSQLSSAYGKEAVEQATGLTSAQAQAALGRKKGEDPSTVISGARLGTRYGVSFLEGALGGSFSATINQVRKSGNATGVAALEQAISKDGRRVLSGARIESPNASVAFLQPNAKEIFDDEIMGGLPKLFDEATSKFGAPLKPGKVGINELVSNSAVQAIKGYFFEGFARRVSQNLIADSIQDKTDPIFDFTGAGNVQDLKRMFGGKFVDPNEFKVAPTTDNIANAISKAISLRGSSGIQLFASGGGVGTDTVPALLTPGEFVINRSSAQRIGYGNLNRMNKIGKYAKGGTVQRFADGGAAVATARSTDAVVATLSKKEAARVQMAMKKNADVFDKLTDEMSRMSLTAEEAKAAYKGLARSLEAGKKSEDALQDARDAAYKQLTRSGAGLGRPDRPAPQFENVVNSPARRAAVADAMANDPRQVEFARVRANRDTFSRGNMGKTIGAKDPMAAAMAMTMVTASLQAMLPPLDEHASATVKITHKLLGMITTIGGVILALQSFGINLKSQNISKFLSGGGMSKRSMASMRGGLMDMGFSRKFSTNVTGIANGLSKLAGPLVAVAGSAYIATELFNTVIEGIYDYNGRLKDAIEAGNVEKAMSVANEKASFEGANVVRGGGATAGAIAGFILGGPIGAAIGAGLGAVAGTVIANGITAIFGEEALDGLNTLFGGNTRKSAVALAAAQAGAVKTQKALDAAQRVATTAMEDFEKGSISASEALSKIRAASAEVEAQEQRSSKFAQENLKNRSEGGSAVARNIFTLGGLLGETSSQRNRRLGQESAEQIRQSAKFQTEAFNQQSAARQATIRSGFARGRSRSEIEKEAVGNLRERRTQLLQNAQTALQAGDTASQEAFNQAAEEMRLQIEQVEKEMENLEKEVIRAKAAYEAMNLGLRGAEGIAGAMSATMTKFAAGLEVGGNSFVANAEFLSSAMSSAAQAMDPEEIKQATQAVSRSLSEMGVSDKAVSKFENNTNAFVQAQQRYGQSFDKVIGNLNSRLNAGMGSGAGSADELKKAFAEELTVGLGDEAKKNLTDIINGIELSPEEVNAILGGNLEVFGQKLSEAGQKQFEAIVKIAQERQKAEQVVISLINQRAAAEKNLALAQKEAMDLYMEGREVQAKYGGAPITTSERRATILARANAGATSAGINRLRTGSAAELRARQVQIATNFGGIEGRRRAEGGMGGTRGVELDNVSKALEDAQRDQIQTIRDLIKLEEEELRIIQEKNKLEKDSLESLLMGDVEKFMAGQAASGAQAAIASGNIQGAMMFGPEAMGQAFQDIMRQMEAGVQTLFGQQIAGPGGLAEKAARAALAARGINDPRMAQVMAGQTGEEQAIKNRLQELGTALGEAGAAGQTMAEMQFQTASINVQRAELKLAEITARGVAAAEGRSHGGLIYANRGIFVPRGTDTVPAMLTPGEFVVRREAVNRGNNLQLLRAINNGGNNVGMSRGGKVNYHNNGGIVQYKALGDLVGGLGKMIGIDPQIITNLGNVFTAFTNKFNESIKNLQNTKLQVTMSPTSVNVNFTGGGMLNQISGEAKQKLIEEVIQAIAAKYGVSSGGKITENVSTLAKPV